MVHPAHGTYTPRRSTATQAGSAFVPWPANRTGQSVGEIVLHVAKAGGVKHAFIFRFRHIYVIGANKGATTA
jgi:hypothetical protein